MPIVCAEFVAGVTDVREAVINPARWRPLDTQGATYTRCDVYTHIRATDAVTFV